MRIDRADRLPIVGLTMGDPNGIGPEVVLRAILDPGVRRICRPLLVGEAGVFGYYLKKFKLPVTLLPASTPPVSWGRDIVPVIGSPSRSKFTMTPGLPSRAAGALAGRAVELASELWKRGEIDGIVTGPLAKDTLNAAGYRFPGQTVVPLSEERDDFIPILRSRRWIFCDTTPHELVDLVGQFGNEASQCDRRALKVRALPITLC